MGKSIMDVGSRLVELCRQGKNMEAMDELYDDAIESVEAVTMEGEDTSKGIEAVRAKSQWWYDNHEVHEGKIEGPFPHGDRFACFFSYEVTPKATGERMQFKEVALYTVKNDKIVREEFFYGM